MNQPPVSVFDIDTLSVETRDGIPLEGASVSNAALSYATASPCFGICCPLHASCIRYERVSVWGSHGAIPTCVTPTVIPAWPGFVQTSGAVIPTAQSETPRISAAHLSTTSKKGMQ